MIKSTNFDSPLGSKIVIQNKMMVKTSIKNDNAVECCNNESQINTTETCRLHTNCSLPGKSICIFNQIRSMVKNPTSIVNSKDYGYNLSSKLSNILNLCLKQMVNFSSLKDQNKKIQNNEKMNILWISSSTKFLMILISLVFLLHLLPLVSASKPLGNPYKILGVSKQASIKEIRKAYLSLVKEW